MSEILPDLTEQIVFDAPSSESVDVLLSRGVVVTSGVLPPDELESMRIAVDTLYFESLPSRVLFKALEALPFGRVTREPLRTRATICRQLFIESILLVVNLTRIRFLVALLRQCRLSTEYGL